MCKEQSFQQIIRHTSEQWKNVEGVFYVSGIKKERKELHSCATILW
jgi:hypothetical protein